MRFEPNDLRRALNVLDESSDSFARLARVAELRPAKDFRGFDLRGMDFGDDALDEFDFSSCNLEGADFSRTTGLRIASVINSKFDESTKWPANLAAILSGSHNPGAPHSIVDLDRQAEDAINKIESERDKRTAESVLRRYDESRVRLLSGTREERDVATRTLYQLSATVDRLNIPTLSEIVNFSYLKNICDRFLKRNRSKLSGLRNAQFEYSDETIRAVARLPAAERLLGLLPLFARFQVVESSNLRAGLVLAGKIVERSDEGRVLVACGPQLVEIEPEHQSNSMFELNADVSAFSILSIRSLGMGTTRGSEFVEAVFELFFPYKSDKESPTEIFIGLNRKNAVIIRTSSNKKGRLLSWNGVYLKQIATLCGLWRINVMQMRDTPRDNVVEFVHTWWDDLLVKKTSSELHYELFLRNKRFDRRKYQAFESMWKRVLPNFTFELSYIADDGLLRIVDASTLTDT
jgi:hypothetical protein